MGERSGSKKKFQRDIRQRCHPVNQEYNRFIIGRIELLGYGPLLPDPLPLKMRV